MINKKKKYIKYKIKIQKNYKSLFVKNTGLYLLFKIIKHIYN